jgi:hypothetical protein
MPQAIFKPLNLPLGSEQRKKTTHAISLFVGTLLVMRGLYGLFLPSMMGLHLSLVHNLLIISAGGFLCYHWYGHNARASFNTCLTYGIIFLVLSIAGIMGVTELNRLDHTFHGIIALVLLVGAYDWHHTHLRKMF